MRSETLDRSHIYDALTRRLRTTSGLDDQDIQAICSLPVSLKECPPNQTIVTDGERPNVCCLLAEGFCVRAKTLSSGHRQILSIHIPGEIPDLQSLQLHVMDHDLVTLTECVLGFINHTSLREIIRQRPSLAEALWRDTLIDAAIFREWIVNVGQRPAVNRLAHTIMEVRERLKVIGRVSGNRFDLPLTQEQVAEALGITAVHANRIIKQLRDENVVDFHRGRVEILDEARFQELADFEHRYLHNTPSQ
jgi:CRP-like cAMP-binding protein